MSEMILAGRRLWVAWDPDVDGRGVMHLHWGKSRRRHVATLWVNESEGEVPHVTWSIWDHDGTGGENATGLDLASALEAALCALLRQSWIPDLRATEMQNAMSGADMLTGEWRAARGLSTLRWSYSG